MQVSLLSGLQPLHGVSVEQDGASRVAVTAFDPGTRNVMGLRRQSMPFEKPATSPDDSPVIDVHVLHKNQVRTQSFSNAHPSPASKSA